MLLEEVSNDISPLYMSCVIAAMTVKLYMYKVSSKHRLLQAGINTEEFCSSQQYKTIRSLIRTSDIPQ